MGSKRAFTLIEMLLVMGIIGMLAAIISPAINRARFRAIITSTAASGCGIIKAVELMANMDPNAYTDRLKNAGKKFLRFPILSKYSRAEEYFAMLVSNKLIHSFDRFGGYGLKQAKSFQEFLNGGCCIWQVANDAEYLPPYAPILVTRNMAIDQLNSLGYDEPIDYMTRKYPFGNRGLVIINRSGNGLVIYGKDLEKASFTNLYRGSKFTNQWIKVIGD